MKKRFNLLTLLLSITGSFILGIIVAFIAMIFYVQHINNNSDNSQEDLQRFTTVYNDLNKGYYKKVDSKKLINSAIDGMVSSLDDPYTEYVTPDEMESFNNNLSGDVSGIGVMVSAQNEEIKVVSVVKNSPAKKAGIKSNDIITKINDTSTTGMTLNDASGKIQGKIGSTVKLTIKRGKNLITKSVKREKLTVSSVEWKLDSKNKKIGYIQIKEFTDNTAKDLKSALKKLDKKNVDKVMLDLRDNPGGQLDQAISAAGMFLKVGDTVVSTTDRTKNKTVYKVKANNEGGYKFKKPAVILVNGNSASAAEVFTAALNENIKTPIVGTTTFGKGIVQTVVPVTDDSEFKLTTAKWLTPKNNWIHHKGIKPTTKVQEDVIMNSDGFKDDKAYKENDKNSDIKFAQQVLKRIGYKVETNSVLDSTTEKSLKDYQKSQKITETGKLDKATKSALLVSLASYLQQNDPIYQKALNIK